MHHDINLNIHYSAPEDVWLKIYDVYKTMPYWCGDDKHTGQTGEWSGKDIDLYVSVEPGGIQITGFMPEHIWNEWYAELKIKLTKALCYPIGKPEEGYEFKYWEPFEKNYADLKSMDKEKIIFNDGSMFYWNQFDKIERNLKAKPACFVFESPYIQLRICFEESGAGYKRKKKEQFHDFDKQLKDIGIDVGNHTNTF